MGVDCKHLPPLGGLSWGGERVFYEERKTLDQNPIMKSKKPFVGPKRWIIISFVVFKGELFCGLKGKSICGFWGIFWCYKGMVGHCAREQIVTNFSLAYHKHCGRVVNTLGLTKSQRKKLPLAKQPNILGLRVCWVLLGFWIRKNSHWQSNQRS